MLISPHFLPYFSCTKSETRGPSSLEVLISEKSICGKISKAIVVEAESPLMSMCSAPFLKSKFHHSKHKALKIKDLVFLLHLELKPMPSKLTGSPAVSAGSNNHTIAWVTASTWESPATQFTCSLLCKSHPQPLEPE